MATATTLTARRAGALATGVALGVSRQAAHPGHIRRHRAQTEPPRHAARTQAPVAGRLNP
jgi:hypothetical protein